MIMRLLHLLVFLAAALPPASGGATAVPEDAHARAVVDALLDWNLPLAERRLDDWRRTSRRQAVIVLYEAIIEVARADYAPVRDTAKYDLPLVRLEAAMAAADEVLAGSPDDFPARGAKATAQAIAGRLLMEQGRWIRAYRHGKAARNAIRALLRERPAFADGYLIMGLFEYFTGTVPAVVRWLALLVDFSGDRQRGIDYLERAVASAPVAAPQAADALLLEVDFHDGEACRYVPLARSMVGRYPRNPRYRAALRRLVRQCQRAAPDRRLPPAAFTLAAPAR